MANETAYDPSFESRLPTPLAKLYRQAYLADSAFDRHLNAFYLWEATIKLIGSVAIANWAADQVRDREIVTLLESLREPTFDDWLDYIRQILPILARQGHPSLEPVWAFVYRDKHQKGLPKTRYLTELLVERTEGRRRVQADFRVSELLEYLARYRGQEMHLSAGANRSDEFYSPVASALGASFEEIFEYLDPFGDDPLSILDESSNPSDPPRPIDRLVGAEPLLALESVTDQTGPREVYPVRGGGARLSPLVVFTPGGHDISFLNSVSPTRQMSLLNYLTGQLIQWPLSDFRHTFFPSLVGADFTIAEPAGFRSPSINTEDERQTIRLPGFSGAKLIGEGGMARVYSAWQESLGREVAIKVLPCEFHSARTGAKFMREFDVLSRVSHPNVIGLYEIGNENGTHYLVLPFLKGPLLSDWIRLLRDSDDPSERRAINELALEIASGLSAVHEIGWIHGDVKPSNVIVIEKTGKAVLFDFNLAKRVSDPDWQREDELPVGTPRYMSPEQVAGGEPDFRSDIFSFGCLLWELLTGEPLVRAATPVEIYAEIGGWTNRRSVRDMKPSIPRDSAEVVSRCLEPDPERRYANAAELAIDLRRCLNSEPILARHHAARERWLRFARRHRVTMLCAAGSAIVSAGATALTFLSTSSPPPIGETPPTADRTGWYVAAGLALVLIYQMLASKRRHKTPLTPAPKPDPVPQPEPKPLPQPIVPRPRVASSEEAFSSQTVVLRYPAPIAVAYRRFCARKEPRGRLAQLFDTFEITVKYLLYLAMSDLCSAHLRKSPRAPLPKHQGFDFLRRPTRMTVGQWVRALRDASQVLAKENDRFVDELPAICGPGSYLDKEIFGWIAENRNLATHRKGGISLSSEKCVPILREARPKLERLFQEIAFVRRYPLGFVTAGYPIGGGLKRYRVHSCLGARLAFGSDSFSVDAATDFPLGVPFVVHPDDSKVLCLWPFLLQRESDVTQRPSLYVFEEIQEDAGFLTSVQSSAIDHEDDWLSRLNDPVDNHDWLWQALEELPQTVAVSPELRLHEGVSESLIGRLTGESLGKQKQYKLIAPIARGGFGTVYQAVDTRTQTEVAVKVLEDRDGLDSGDDAVQFRRFQQEFDKLKQAGKEHPGIVRCFESGNDILGRREYPWYSMEFAGGGDLTGRLLERRSQLGEQLVWDVPELRNEASEEFRSIAEAVSHLHDLNIIHRDVKPANVLILDEGDIRLSDFGLVKDAAWIRSGQSRGVSSSRGAIVGTREYMAPEQERGEAVTKAADVYSLGVVLAELLTGRRPEPESKVAAGSLLEKDPYLDRLPEPLRRLILRCSDLDPEVRPRDAHDLLHRFDLAVKESVATE
jgi:serine/threonine protein kinase